MSDFMHALDGANRWFVDSSFESVMLSLLLAFVLGQGVAWVYAWSHSGLSYSRSFTQSLVLMTLITSLVMQVIGDSIVTAFGLLGALALIRFRNVLKDTRDTVFVFISLVIGMAVGSQRYTTAIIGAIAVSLAVWYLDLTSFGSLGRFDGYLTCRMESQVDRSKLRDQLNRFCRAIKPVSSRQSGDETGTELVYQVGLRDRERGNELLDELRKLDGIRHVSLVIRNELSEI
jgi:uncharacterized membrane protein YhiD involved in acid resistance